MLAALAAHAETICGAKPTHHMIDYAEVACIDFDALANLSPFFIGQGQQTQVLIHAKAGDAVAVTVDGVTKYQKLVTDHWGRRIALVPFNGNKHTTVSVRVLAEI